MTRKKKSAACSSCEERVRQYRLTENTEESSSISHVHVRESSGNEHDVSSDCERRTGEENEATTVDAVGEVGQREGPDEGDNVGRNLKAISSQHMIQVDVSEGDQD